MIFKLIGILLIIFGIFMLVGFPGAIYQRSDMTKTGLLFGLCAFLIGILLLVFG